MPSLFRRTIRALKDQTSISLAKISSSSDLDVAVLKATSHDELPVEERHVTEVLLLSSSSPLLAAACVRALSRRISRTQNWVVALKALTLTFRLIRHGGPYFKHEALAPLSPPSSSSSSVSASSSSPPPRRRRRRLLDLSSFRDNCSPSPWDFTAFVRTFALYLDACLEAALLGKLDAAASIPLRRPTPSDGGNLPAVLDRVVLWQRLLDRAIHTRPTGLAQSSRLVQIALYPVVRETFDLYRGVSEGLSLLLDNFFRLQQGMCLETFNACVTASKQFDELESFYRHCRNIGVGRTSEYPCVQKISSSLLKSLEVFSRNWQPAASVAASPKHNILSHLLEPWRKNSSAQDVDQDSDTSTSHRSSTIDKNSTTDWGSEFSDQSWSLDAHVRASFASSSSSSSMSSSDKWITKDLVPFHPDAERIQASSKASKLQEWELALIASMDEASNRLAYDYRNIPLRDHRFVRAAEGKQLLDLDRVPQSTHNPFLIGAEQTRLAVVPWSSTPPPTFRADSPSGDQPPAEAKNDPFSASDGNFTATSDASARWRRVDDERRLWMQQQRKILAKSSASSFG